MALAPRLDLRQSQSLVMTPQLQQAIKLLAYSNLELESYLAEMLEGNPLLEAVSGEAEGASLENSSTAYSAEAEAPEAPLNADLGEEPAIGDALPEPMGTDQLLGNDHTSADELDVDFAEERFHHDCAHDGIGAATDQHGLDFDNFASKSATLHEYLRAQAGERLNDLDFRIAEQIIGWIDEAGYLRGDLAELAQLLGITMEKAESVLHIIQSFDPSGVGARNLAECLAIQARDVDRYDPAMAAMIANLELVAKGAFAQLKRICGVDDEDLADMIRELRQYDPKPGLCFGGSIAQPVVPDVFVRAIGSSWSVEMNSATLPRLLVNRRYHQSLSQGAEKSSRAWLSEQLAGANWLVRALDQRQRTIIKVASEIVKQQEGFFRHGVAHMRPLTLRQVADAISMHESTVSRVTSHKYLSCQRGLFELKYFFSSGIAAKDGDGAVSAEAIKSRIRTMIESEGAKSILSDEAMAQKLAVEGFDIARRTVVKYREAMGFGSSVQRRRQKALAG